MSVQNAIPKKQLLPLLIFLVLFLLGGCSAGQNSQQGQNTDQKEGYRVITPKEAKEIMDTQSDYIILDVRRQDEYQGGHIPNAMLLPLDEIQNRAEKELPDKNQTILVYCRSGRRSETAAKALVALGYTDIRDFGGILDWPYDIVKDS